jgi:hypothetical protein
MPGSVDHPVAEVELYDLIEDPGETRNVAAKYPDIVSRLRAMLNRERTR